MDIILLPSILIGVTQYYLKLDVITFIEVLGGTPKVSLPEDAFNRTWRKDLENLLIHKGLDWQRAGTIAHHIFPPDGLSLAQIADQIIDLSLDNTYMIQDTDKERKEIFNENDQHMVEEIIGDSENPDPVSPTNNKKKKDEPKSNEEFTFTQNFYDSLEKKHESLLAHDDNLEEAFYPHSSSDSEESNNEMEIDNHYSNLKKNINYSFPQDFFLSPSNINNNNQGKNEKQFNNKNQSYNDDQQSNNYNNQNEGNVEIVEDVPETLPENKIFDDKRRERLKSRLSELNIDLDSDVISSNPSYVYMIDQFTKGLVAEEDIITVLNSVPKHKGFINTLDSQISNLSLQQKK